MDHRDQAFYDRMVELGLYTNPSNLAQHLRTVFRDVPIEGRNVLDIGGGAGVLSLAAAHRGAERVVLVEPEEDGSRSGVNQRFLDGARALGFENRAELQVTTIQDFDPAGRQFDMVVSYNSINHVEEDACVELGHSAEARRTYVRLLDKIRAMLTPGADLIVCDCGRRNFFGDLGLRNPMSPTIEWHKHQQPGFWLDLLEEAGFQRRDSRWVTFNSLGAFGETFLANAAATYFLTSNFRLWLQNPA